MSEFSLTVDVMAEIYFAGVLILWYGAIYSASKYSLVFILSFNVLR